MSIYEVPARELPLRQKHNLEQMQIKLQNQSDTISTAATSSTVSATLTPAQLTLNTTVEEAFTVSGVSVGDLIAVVGHPTMPSGIFIGPARVTDTDVVTMTFSNGSGANRTPTAGTYTFRVIK